MDVEVAKRGLSESTNAQRTGSQNLAGVSDSVRVTQFHCTFFQLIDPVHAGHGRLHQGDTGARSVQGTEALERGWAVAHHCSDHGALQLRAASGATLSLPTYSCSIRSASSRCEDL